MCENDWFDRFTVTENLLRKMKISLKKIPVPIRLVRCDDAIDKTRARRRDYHKSLVGPEILVNETNLHLSQQIFTPTVFLTGSLNSVRSSLTNKLILSFPFFYSLIFIPIQLSNILSLLLFIVKRPDECFTFSNKSVYQLIYSHCHVLRGVIRLNDLLM